jgi:hypothetical protein
MERERGEYAFQKAPHETFELHIESDGFCHAARTVWKGHGKIGVAFG